MEKTLKKMYESFKAIEAILVSNQIRLQYSVRKSENETEADWYVGVTGQGFDDNGRLTRITQHNCNEQTNNKRCFPNLDWNSVGHFPVKYPEVATEVESQLKGDGFDIGEKTNEPTDENVIIVYVFRKDIKTRV